MSKEFEKRFKCITLGGYYWVQRFIKEIDYTKCNGCRFCVKVCPAGVFKIEDEKVVVANGDLCRGCEVCEKMCKVRAIKCCEIV